MALVGLAFFGWLAGFVWFLSLISAGRALPPHADGIIALTGGADRVETALHLLVEGKAERLLVSGTGPSTELRTLAHLAGVDAAGLAHRVTLGRAAISTRGNALEAAAWVRATGATSLIVVTAYYHMPRTLAELGPALPGVTLHPFPVGGEADHQAAIRLLAEEYTKYLLVMAGVTGLLPTNEALHPAAES
jgi:uncharacterized SAM-binding protein YcdF (DUF218 family)